MTFRIIDKDNDIYTLAASDESMWDSLEDCIDSIKTEFQEETDNGNYLPWRIVEWDEAALDKEEMEVHARITDKCMQPIIQYTYPQSTTIPKVKRKPLPPAKTLSPHPSGKGWQ